MENPFKRLRKKLRDSNRHNDITRLRRLFRFSIRGERVWLTYDGAAIMAVSNECTAGEMSRILECVRNTAVIYRYGNKACAEYNEYITHRHE